jgi:hypothetical protein
MATLRVRFKLNPGRKGIAMSKLSKQTENIEMFLRSLAGDLGVDDAKNLWLADDFRSGSFIDKNELQAIVDAETAYTWNEALNALSKAKGNLAKASLPRVVSTATIDRFASLSEALDPDESIGISVYDLETERSKPFTFVSKLQLEAVGRSIETETKYVGAVMGTTYEWNKGADKPYLYIRELNSAELVKCTYSDEDYENVSRLFSKKTAVVIIEGHITFNLITSKTEVTKATGFDFAPEFSDSDFEKFFGAAPGITGELTSEEYVAHGRRERH